MPYSNSSRFSTFSCPAGREVSGTTASLLVTTTDKGTPDSGPAQCTLGLAAELGLEVVVAFLKHLFREGACLAAQALNRRGIEEQTHYGEVVILCAYRHHSATGEAIVEEDIALAV